MSLLLVVCTQSEEFKKEVQKFTAPVYGSYKIQCWGAQGAFPLENLEYVSGKGGYSEGIWRPTTVNTIYICLGQLGSAAYIKGQIARLAYNNSPDNINGFLLGGSGGGGWYGGGGASYTGAAGGGSSYIGGVTKGKTIAGDSTDPKQPTPDGNSVQVGQSGDGACVITQLSFN